MNRNHKPLSLAICITAALLLSAAGTAAAPSGKLVVFHAGSLSVPFEEMEKAFEARYPGVDIERQSGGSTKMARMISEEGKTADIMASADFAVIDKTLIPDHASWNIRFATNQMVLCYTDRSAHAAEIDAKNWFEILARPDVSWGHSDPDLDPAGYRSLMVLQLAEAFYEKPGLYRQLIDARPPENVRPKAVELVNMLKAGELDYAWEYLSVAVQHGLRHVTLDPHINLSDYRFDRFYRKAAVEVTGEKAGTFLTRTGASITYGVTQTNAAPNPEAAVAFLDYLLDPDGGLAVLSKMGQPPLVPARVPDEDTVARLPEPLRARVQPAE
jgi:molybdate/tungstate transport system substrate-binding protein